MDPKERLSGDLTQTLIAMLQGWQADLWTALPGIIQSVNFAEQTCVVQISIQMSVRDIETGVTGWQSISPLLDCPLFFPHGGSMSITFPVAEGDECLVVFASRCIDGWFESAAVQPQALFRMHDLSDGFVFAGFRSKPKVIAGISSTKLQIRSADGTNVIEVDPTAGKITLTAVDEIVLDAPTITAVGQLVSQGGIAAEDGINLSGGVLMINGHLYTLHSHSGVTSGGGTSGPVVP